VYKVIDGDGHIFEWEQTFADEFLDEQFRHRRPVVVDGPQQLLWLVDNITYPGLYGDRLSFTGSPVSRGDVRRDSIVPKPESLGVLEIRDASERIALHRDEGIDVAVIYPTCLLIRPLSTDVAFEAALCRSYNSWMTHVCAADPDALKWVAVIDMNDPEAAATEIHRCKGIGAVGVMLPGMNGTEGITDDRFEPIWAACAETDLAVGVHVAYCTPLNSFTFVYSLLMGFEQVCASGVFDRYPALRVSFLEASCNWGRS
jgi:predicted TIM-barrel fold metal-dependent hydrolase